MQVIGLVSKYSKNVDFVWLPSHIGIKGNELADKLANAATAKPSIDVNIGLELSEAYTLIDRFDTFLASGNICGIRKPEGRTTGQWKKTVSTQVKYLHPSRHTEVIIGRLRLGKCYLNAYLHYNTN